MNKMNNAGRLLVLLLAALMALSLAACGAKGVGKMGSEPKSLEEAVAMHKELMAQAMKYAQCRLSVPTLDQVAAAALYTLSLIHI